MCSDLQSLLRYSRLGYKEGQERRNERNTKIKIIKSPLFIGNFRTKEEV